jgi:hypothetical protein
VAVTIAGQVDPTTAPLSIQSNFRAMVGEVLQWNPEAPPTMAMKWVQNAYRRVIDMRYWYGMLIRGQVTVPTVYSTGTATFTQGSPIVTGVGTAWTAGNGIVANMQMRTGFSTGWYNIQSVDSPTQVTLDLPWGNPTVSSAYSILQTWISLGYNIKAVSEMVNQRQGWRMKLNIPQAVLNNYDTWRTTTGWTYMLANREPRANGEPVFELYPAPTYQQIFPFLAYIQPPDLVADADTPVTFVRSDIIVRGALKDALMYRGKTGRYYDPASAAVKEQEFQTELANMASVDDSQYMQNLKWDYDRWPFYQYGSQYMQSHAGAPGEW